MREGVARLTMLACVAAAAIVFVIAGGLAADNYPTRPIILVIPLPPGGTNDIMARAVADKMSAALGQRIVIENRNAGGSGTVGTREVARAAPDGYTIILGYTSTLTTGPHIFSNAGYDPRKDFAPLGLIASAPALLLVHREAVHISTNCSHGRRPGAYWAKPGRTVKIVDPIRQAGVRVSRSEKASNPLITDMMGGFVKVGF